MPLRNEQTKTTASYLASLNSHIDMHPRNWSRKCALALMPMTASVLAALRTEGSATLTPRQAANMLNDKLAAGIMWLSCPGCDLRQGDNVIMYAVGTLSTQVYSPGGCDVGRPSFSNSATGNIKALPFSPRSLCVCSTPQTFTPDEAGGQELAAIKLYSSCQRKAGPDEEGSPSFCDCPDVVQWGVSNKGFNSWVESSAFAGGNGPFGFTINEAIRFCR